MGNKPYGVLNGVKIGGGWSARDQHEVGGFNHMRGGNVGSTSRINNNKVGFLLLGILNQPR